MSFFPEVYDAYRRGILQAIFNRIVPEDPLFWAFALIANINMRLSLLNMSVEEQNVIGDPTTWTEVLKTYKVQWNSPLVQERDNHTCLLTGSTGPRVEAVRIGHFSPGMAIIPLEDPTMDRFWERMSTLFTVCRVQRWKTAVANAEDSSGILQNMLRLSEPARRLWKEGAFALKPLDSPEPTATSLSVEFHWIGWRPNADLTECPPLYNHRTRQYIRSGDIFIICTDDPGRGPDDAGTEGGIDEVNQAVYEEESQDGEVGWGTVVEMLHAADDEPFSDERMFTMVGLYDAGQNFDAFVNYSGIVGGP
ncbi:hypothetical protein ASPSYDRAFT_90704 [Aspergillus sydowii CBS 593.65]|uniref:HNH nuclease domain-containing protein n=1 Tax=Aspergillus sydowii CBS 593.65 TaxID=1036612 RepID=A0A1L9TDB7_9EURO|nr:uncharacterized protein ASPSYDRAFT_90704 [Aspergillus sydowii CBS 593.65]OJJ57412.1 hypothetical protein ASPSYDRAFT_90704 [Aspergillus sydowii CBS 593.65]